MYTEMAQWFEPARAWGFLTFILFLFCFVLSELYIVKVINCFFFFF